MLRLVVMTGLPCSGKSTIAYGLAAATKWPVFSVDPIESAMRNEGVDEDAAGWAAYAVAERLAEEQRGVGLSAIVDGCNVDQELRDGWRALTARTGARLDVIECRTEEALHRARVAGRIRGLAHFAEVTWERVEDVRAQYRPWEIERLRLDTGSDAPDALIARAVDYVSRL